MLTSQSANRELAAVTTWLGAEVTAHEPLWVVEGETAGGCWTEEKATKLKRLQT